MPGRARGRVSPQRSEAPPQSRSTGSRLTPRRYAERRARCREGERGLVLIHPRSRLFPAAGTFTEPILRRSSDRRIVTDEARLRRGFTGRRRRQRDASSGTLAPGAADACLPGVGQPDAAERVTGLAADGPRPGEATELLLRGEPRIVQHGDGDLRADRPARKFRLGPPGPFVLVLTLSASPRAVPHRVVTLRNLTGIQKCLELLRTLGKSASGKDSVRGGAGESPVQLHLLLGPLLHDPQAWCAQLRMDFHQRVAKVRTVADEVQAWRGNHTGPLAAFRAMGLLPQLVDIAAAPAHLVVGDGHRLGGQAFAAGGSGQGCDAGPAAHLHLTVGKSRSGSGASQVYGESTEGALRMRDFLLGASHERCPVQ